TARSNAPGYFMAIDDAAFTGGANGTSFLVDGYVKYFRSTSATTGIFEFPVGQGIDYRPLTISAAIPDHSSFAVAWFSGDPAIVSDPTDGSTHSRHSKGPDVVSVMPHGFWDWQNLAGTAAGMAITVSIPDVSAQAQASNLILVGWDGTEWVNLSGAVGAGSFSGNWANGNTEGDLLSGSWQPNITAIGIGSRSFVLPLKLESFMGETTGCKAELTWKMQDEEAASHFTLQASTDGFAWQSITKLAAQGNGTGRAYQYTIEQNERTVRYRLLMSDKSGQVTFSPVISLNSNCGQDASLSIFPNPVTAGSGLLKIHVQALQHENATLLLRNTAGQVIHQRIILLNQGYNTINLTTEMLVPGTYLLSIADEKGNSLYPSKKLIKK
ncbi:MAG TPA: T9SS type A sorting domain-containing protein, partial [Fibrella sp.]